jgi:hypothetical protein
MPFFMVYRIHRNLPVPAITIQGRENNGVSDGVYTLVHPREWVCVRYSDVVFKRL